MSAVFTVFSEKLVSISVAIGASIKTLLSVSHFFTEIVEIWCEEVVAPC